MNVFIEHNYGIISVSSPQLQLTEALSVSLHAHKYFGFYLIMDGRRAHDTRLHHARH